MPFKVKVEKYPEAMKGLIGYVTGINAGNGQRTRNSGSAQLHDLILSGGGHEITLKLNESDLYIFGFSNGNGTYRFADKAILGATALPIGCSYTAADGLGILRARDAGTATAQRTLQSILQAIQTLEGYNGGAVNAADLATMCYFISEAMRFKNVYRKMCNVVRNGAYFTFAEFADWVTNWSNISGGGAVVVPHGQVAPTQADLSTYY